ncbi:DivIVA domain-containing protein [Streptomyces sp. CA2R106]|uniref:DivIVA domain-containing protein n=1 Tax=Streptomyces sp. CA2R106 TaxID=3120153 RepID=UPI003FA72FA6
MDDPPIRTAGRWAYPGSIDVFWFMLIALVAVVAAVALAVLGDGGALKDAEPERLQDRLPPDRPLARADVDAVRLPVGLRGYRMVDVDEVLERLGAELAERDARIAELEAHLAGGRAGGHPYGAPAGPAAPGQAPRTAPEGPYGAGNGYGQEYQGPGHTYGQEPTAGPDSGPQGGPGNGYGQQGYGQQGGAGE